MNKLSHDPYNLIITGVGGQGNVLISQLLGRALIGRGYKVAIGETFGLSQRGGSVQSHIRISSKRFYGPLIPDNHTHLVLGIEPLETLRVLPQYGRDDLKIIANSRPVHPLNVIAGESEYPEEAEMKSALEKLSSKLWWINATRAAGDLGASVMANVVLLGALAGADLLPVSTEDFEASIQSGIPEAKLELNLKAFHKGIELAG